MKKLTVGIVGLLLFRGIGLAENRASLVLRSPEELVSIMANASADNRDRIIAANELIEILESTPSVRGIPAESLAVASNSTDVSISVKALHALSLLGNSESIPVIEKIAKDKSKNWQIRIAAIEGYGAILRRNPGAPVSEALLREFIEESDCRIQASAGIALVNFNAQDVESVFNRIISENAADRKKRGCALRAIAGLGYLDSPSAMKSLESLRSHSDDFVRGEAIEAIHKARYRNLKSDDQRMEMLANSLADGSWGPQRYWAQSMLLEIYWGRIPGNRQRALAILKSAARDPNHPAHQRVEDTLKPRCKQNPEFCY